MMRTVHISILVALLFILAASPGPAHAQCLTSGVSVGGLSKTTGNPAVDAKINAESALLGNAFGVNPNLLVFDDSGSPNALTTAENTAPGAFGTILFGFTLLASELWILDKGEVAVAGIMAHEFNHLVQIRRQSSLSGKNRELHADFMAGWYIGKKSYLMPTDIRGFANSLFQKGDFAFWNPSHHGTPLERVSAMLRGFQSRTLSFNDAYSTGEHYLTGDDTADGQGTGGRSEAPSPTPVPRWREIREECHHPAHPNGDVSPCRHQAHAMGDLNPCTHVCANPYNPYAGAVRCHPQGDLFPCVHQAHPQGDLGPCSHVAHPEGHIRRVAVDPG